MIPTTQSSSTRVSAISETFVVSTSKAPHDILEALLALDQTAASPYGKRLSVRVSGNQFIIARRTPLPNPFSRSIFGVAHERSSGSVVDYNFSVNPAIKILFSMWFALMSVALITGVTAIMTSGITEIRIELVVLAIVFLSSALGTVALCLLASRKGEKELEQKLQAIICDTTTVEQH